ncbi:hypothetical protein GGR52DRAFT_455980 [Hypoxylon sp. FL1284]|nr:hypothetical protein GGR52DRAFT_455980 [Hypoxylon sp. FL1284]
MFSPFQSQTQRVKSLLNLGHSCGLGSSKRTSVSSLARLKMDWPKDYLGIDERDLRNVFKYETKKTRAIVLERSRKEPSVKDLETSECWEEWMETELPSPNSPEPGLVLILARRAGEQVLPTAQDDDNPVEKEKRSLGKPDKAASFPVDVGGMPNAEKGLLSSSHGRRSASTLPFSLDTFRKISNKFFIHGSIARVINRADVPIFSRAQLQMRLPDEETYPTFVYNCRSTNVWEMDLALTVTHFPHSGRTYAILFGCSTRIEEEVIKRLCYSGVQAGYPLLLPGIFAELERDRHIDIVEKYMDELETKILELDYQPSIDQKMRGSNSESRNREKRSQWLDMMYLRNGLTNWCTQLSKMASHTEELRGALFRPSENFTEGKGHDQFADINEQIQSLSQDSTLAEPYEWTQHLPRDSTTVNIPTQYLQLFAVIMNGLSLLGKTSSAENDEERRKAEMRKAGAKIKDRLLAIIEEYEDKIRECTMRIDGMAMTTQWADGEANVEIALATGRESRHMRSIAVVTMIFLPGTFFAGIFSMQFFNWIPDDDENTIVSRYFWIYVLVTVVATALTLGTWYYFALWREKRQTDVSGEEAALVS